jgi:hypothetical protein
MTGFVMQPNYAVAIMARALDNTTEPSAKAREICSGLIDLMIDDPEVMADILRYAAERAT